MSGVASARRGPFGPNGPFQTTERERFLAEMDQLQATCWASFAPSEHSCTKGGPCLCKKGRADGRKADGPKSLAQNLPTRRRELFRPPIPHHLDTQPNAPNLWIAAVR